MNGRKWTEDEDIYLEYFVYENDATIQAAARFLNRTEGAVNTRLTALRKNDAKTAYMKRRWKKSEDQFLKDHYKLMTDELLSKRLMRTIQSIKSRRKYLRLSRTRPVHIHKKKILELIKEGYYRTEIAKELDVDVKSLSTFLRQNNIYCKPVLGEQRTEKMKQRWGYAKQRSNQSTIRN